MTAHESKTPGSVLLRLSAGTYTHTDAQRVSGEGARPQFFGAESRNGRDQLAPPMRAPVRNETDFHG